MQAEGIGPKRPVTWLEMGLHDQPANLRREIQGMITRIEADPEVDTILLAYGRCGNGLVGIQSKRCRLVLPRAHDCITVLLGSMEAHAKLSQECPEMYYYSPGWLRWRRVPGPERDAYLRTLYSERYPEDPDRVNDLLEADRETFAHHSVAGYVDLTDNKQAEKDCRDCARHLGWTYRRLQGDRSFLRELLTGPWPEQRFLVVEAGYLIAVGPNDTLVQAPGSP